ncbi:MAG: nucleoside 2-deoxyribosyltransferase domain-containing protein [Patescibacteria group bacterium]
MQVIIAPEKITKTKKPVIFLAGSIEMGKAEDWQTKVANQLKKYSGTLLNPRREHWGEHWKQSVTNKKFKEQLEWELKGLSQSDCVVLYFSPKAKSPISLLELGLFARSHKIICCCPQKFWRYGNVEFICQKFKIPLVSNLEELIIKLEKSKIINDLLPALKKAIINDGLFSYGVSCYRSSKPERTNLRHILLALPCDVFFYLIFIKSNG